MKDIATTVLLLLRDPSPTRTGTATLSAYPAGSGHTATATGQQRNRGRRDNRASDRSMDISWRPPGAVFSRLILGVGRVEQSDV